MFSLAPRGLDESDSRSDGSANLNRKKLLMIGATTVGVLLVGIGGVIWCNSGSPADPVPVTNTTHSAGGGDGAGSGVKVDAGGGGIEFGGGSVGGQPINTPPSPPQASPILDRLMTVAKTHAMLTVGVLIGVFLLITAIVALVVYQTTSNQEFIDGNGGVENGVTALDGRKVDATKEEDEGVPVFPIILAVAALVLIAVVARWWFNPIRSKGLGRGGQKPVGPLLPNGDGGVAKKTTKEPVGPEQIKEPSKEPSKELESPHLPKADTEVEAQLKALQKFRDLMSLDSMCVSANGLAVPKNKPYKVGIWSDGNILPIHCPKNFTPNSVWWAFKDKAEESDLVMPYLGSLAFFAPQHDGADEFRIRHQYQVLENIPGNDGIPFFPRTDDSTDIVKALDAEFIQWHNFATGDKMCVHTSEKPDYSHRVDVFFGEILESIYCKTAKPTIKSVYSAIFNYMSNFESKFAVSLPEDDEYEVQLLFDDEDKIEMSRQSIWQMYEPFRFM